MGEGRGPKPLVGGLLRVLFSLVAPFPGWSWILLNGVVDLVNAFS